MKRLPRDPEKFDPLELYSAVSRKHGYEIGVDRHFEEYQSRIGASLRNAIRNSALLHGKQVEAMFAYVLGALGRCELIKQEDSGEIFAHSGDYQIPDYRVVTNEGETFLIEVKNFNLKHPDSVFKVKQAYFTRLQNYADKNRALLKFAIHFPTLNRWTLISPDSFARVGDRMSISLPDALAKNELSLLGDRMLATIPPLALRFVGDPNDDRAIVKGDGKAVFTIREIDMKCGSEQIDSESEKNIAFYLMRYGNWILAEQPAQIEGGRLLSFEFVFAPETPSEDQTFQVIGDLSSMVSSAFKEKTVGNKGVVALGVDRDPDFFQLTIPEGYQGKHLPLWQFIIQPNFEYAVDG